MEMYASTKSKKYLGVTIVSETVINCTDQSLELLFGTSCFQFVKRNSYAYQCVHINVNSVGLLFFKASHKF